MAAIIRVKRKRNDDPAEALLLACKKRKEGEENKEAALPSEITEVLKFAGTIPSRDISVSSKIRDAIRKEKLEKEYKKHNIDLPLKARQSVRKSSGRHRYEVITSRRAINLDHLDDSNTDKPTENTAATNPSKQDEGKNSETSTEDGLQKSSKVFCLYDVENVNSRLKESVAEVLNVKDDLSSIMCNSVPMIREKVDMPADSKDFVYDLYYTNRTGLDFQALETVLRVEAYCDNTYMGDDGDDSDLEVYDDDDDSNDEGNWRNDYPEEDPLYFENAEEDFLYEEDMNPTHLVTRTGYGLEQMMAAKCNLDASDSSNSGDEIDPYTDSVGRRSYEAYVKDVSKILQDDNT